MKTDLRYGKEHCFDGGRVLVRPYCLEPNARDDRFESQFRRFEVYLDGVLEYVGPKFIEPVKEVRTRISMEVK